jgi:hypothetical protein
MTLRIEESLSTDTAVARVIGRLGGKHLEEVEQQFEDRQRKNRAATSGGMKLA